MNAYSIAAPEDIAKKYGGNKKKIQQAASQGLISPTEAVMAGMFIDRIRNAAQAEQAQQPTVAEQVMNPQPQMPPQGMAAMPQAQQMLPQAQMGAPMQRMAMGGGLDSIPYNEGDYAEGGIVSFRTAGALTKEQMISQLNQQYLAAGNAQERAEIRAKIDNIMKMGTVVSPGGQAITDSRLNQDSSFTGTAPFATTDLGSTAEVMGGADTTLANRRRRDFETPYVPDTETGFSGAVESPRIDPNRFSTGTLTESIAKGIEIGNRTRQTDSVGDPESAMALGSEYTLPNRIRRDFEIPFVEDTETGFSGAVAYANKDPARINPSGGDRFNTGTLTEAEARRIEGDKGNRALGAFINDPFASETGYTGEVPVQRGSEKGLSLLERLQALSSRLQSGFSDASPDDQMAMGPETVRANIEAEKPDAFTGATVKAPVPDPFASQQEAAPEEQTTLVDQVEQVNKATEALGTNTVKKDDPDAAKTALDAANKEADAMTEAAKNTASDDFQKQIEELMKPAEKGEFRKEMEALVKDRGERLKSAKKEAFSMALLQAGLGMLGQGGGQTALQALGKAALPATKDYAAAVKDAKKEDRELLQLGLSMEQMDAKELAATKRTVAQLYGQRANAILQSATSQANNMRSTAASKYGADVGARSRVRAAEVAAEAQKEVTGALRTSELLRKLSADRVDVVSAIDTIRANELMQPGPGLTYYQAQDAFQKDATNANAAKVAAAKKLFDNHIRELTSEYRAILEQNTAMQGQLSQSLMPSGGTGGFTVKRVN